MKLVTLLIFLLISNYVFTQPSNDTTIKKRQLDSLEYVIYKLKDSLRRAQYINVFLSNLSSVDSTMFGKDSVIIDYKSRTGKLIKRQKMAYNMGEVTYEKIEYYNTLQKPEFVEHWGLAKSSADDEGGKTFTWRPYHYERFAYDSIGRVIAWFWFHPAISRRTIRRTDYVYNNKGNPIPSESRIDIEKFWD